MPLYIWNGKLLQVGASLAGSAKCCCDSTTTTPPPSTTLPPPFFTTIGPLDLNNLNIISPDTIKNNKKD